MTDRTPAVAEAPLLRTVAMPCDTNASGAILGGWILSQMDLAGGTFAARRSRGRVVTSSIEAMRFLHAVEVGDEVSCYCSMASSDEKSLTVKMRPGPKAAMGTMPRRSPKDCSPMSLSMTQASRAVSRADHPHETSLLSETAWKNSGRQAEGRGVVRLLV